MSTLIASLAVYLPVSWAISIALFGHHLPPQSTDARPRRLRTPRRSRRP
jgi:hypothetical protein